MLSSAGFSDIGVESLSAAMWFGASPDDAFDFVVGLMGWMVQGLDRAGRDAALENLRDTISQHETNGGEVSFESATWLVTATRS